jgi:hypothetical protein
LPFYQGGVRLRQILFPYASAASLSAFDMDAAILVLAAAAFPAATSSIALASKFRFAASALVVAISSVTVAGTQGASLFVKPGPEYFERQIGQQVSLAPWQYASGMPGYNLTRVTNIVGAGALLTAIKAWERRPDCGPISSRALPTPVVTQRWLLICPTVEIAQIGRPGLH